jgi:hypothetical protein
MLAAGSILPGWQHCSREYRAHILFLWQAVSSFVRELPWDLDLELHAMRVVVIAADAAAQGWRLG